MAKSNPTTSSLFGEEPDDDSFWLKIMAECLENPVTKLPAGKKLLVLGDNDAEKTLLVSKLQGSSSSSCEAAAANFTKGNGLEYRHLPVKDEYCDHQARLGVWILDGDPFYRPLLKYALDAGSLAETTVLLVASMTRPWDILRTIAAWRDALRDHVEALDMPRSELERVKGRILERYREYIEPGLSIYGSLAADNTRELPVNIGVEFIVVVTKTEYMRELQTEFGYEEEHFDFIQLSLRDFCLSHGAALFYVSVKEDKNCDYLLKYILHKIYSFPFRLPGVLSERDSILVPAGWDNKNKIRFLSDTLTTIPSSTPYEDVVFRPARLSDAKRVAPEVSAQRDQEFLADMQSALERQATEEKAQDKDSCSSSMTATVVQRNVARRMTRAQQQQRSPQKKIEAKIASAGEGDTTLSNFFHSLLNRRTSAPVDRPVGLSGTTRTFAPKSHLDINISSVVGINPNNNNNNKGGGGTLQGIKEQNRSSSASGQSSRKSSEEDDSEESFPHPKLFNTAHLSLDEEKEGGHQQQLPEYFLSNPGGTTGGGGVCSADCSFQGGDCSSSSSFDLMDGEFSPPLDRVRSSFNPPLRLLLGGGGNTKPEAAQAKELTNGEVRTVSNGSAAFCAEATPAEDGGRDPAMPLKVNNRSGQDQTSVDST